VRRALPIAVAALALGMTASAPADASSFVYFCEFDICAADADGSNRRNLTRKLSGDYLFPQLSRDGRTLVFVRDGRLYVADRNARHQRVLPAPQPNYAGAAPSNPILRHDAREVLFINGNSIAGTSHICRIGTARGSKPRCGTDGNHGRAYFTWGPKNTVVSIASEGSRDICVTSLNGRCGRVLVRLEGERSFYQEPAVSPDGRFFVATVQWPDNSRIMLFDARSGRLVRDLAGPAGGLQPVWSPSGKSVAFERGMDDGTPESVTQICTVGIKGGKVRCPVKGIVWRGGPRHPGLSWGG
jgi:Tol biopolymer transport system component